MAADAGLSVKERLALLQNNNKNPLLNGPLVPGPSTAPKPKLKSPSTAEPKPPPVALKPTGQGSSGRSTSPKPPPTPAKPASGGGGGSAFPALKPVGAPSRVGKDVSPVSSLRRDATPPVTKKPAGPVKEGGGTENGSAAMKDVNTSDDSGSKPVSVQERLAALKRRSGDGATDSKSKENVNGSTPFKSPASAVSSSSAPAKPGVLKPSNVPKTDANMNTSAVKPSDIFKSVTQAAEQVLLRNKSGHKDSDTQEKKSSLFQRNSDGKKFRQVELASVVSQYPAPAKPTSLDNVDLVTFMKAYATAKEKKIVVDSARNELTNGKEEEWDEFYVEAESTSVPVRTRGSLKRANSARVSQIPEFTEEEEELELYDEGVSAEAPPESLIPEENYDDCLTEQQQFQPEDPEEIYEPLDEDFEPQSVAEVSPKPAEEKKGKKEEEKEKLGKKKDRGKEDAKEKEKKERKKKEEEIKKYRSKFGLSDVDEKVGDGVVKSNAGAGLFSKDLGVSRGEMVAILRMDGNPAGKWLVQNEQGKLGFVSSNNIEVSTPTIRNMMSGVKPDSSHNEEETEELYEPLPDGEMDETYEEF